MNDVLKCTEVLEPFSEGMGVYLTPEEIEYIRNVITHQQQRIIELETIIDGFMDEQHENITGIGQC